MRFPSTTPFRREIRGRAGLLVALVGSASLVISAPLAAQGVTGTVVEAASGRVVPLALVALVDEAGRRTMTALTREDGSFLIRAPGPGSYRLTVEHLGYDRSTTDLVDLTTEWVALPEIGLELRPIGIEGISVTADRACRMTPEDGSYLAAIWDEARRVLSVASWAEAATNLRYRIEHFERRIEAGSGQPLEESTWRADRFGNTAFRSRDAELLERDGYVVEEGGGRRVFYAPDIRVLLSDSFQSSHCFHVARGDGEVGVAFEPIRGRRVTDIAGQFWFDEATGLLDRIEFGYRGAALDPETEHLRSEVHFAPSPTGAWYVRKWAIRTPELSRSWTGSQWRTELAAVHESGAEVLRVSETAGGLPAGVGGAVRGAVFDSAFGGPLEGGIVQLFGTAYEAVTDRSGRFAVRDVAPGEYDLRLILPRPVRAEPPPPPVRISVTAGETTAAALATVDPVRSLGDSHCGGPAPSGTGHLAGELLDVSGRPLPGIEVALRVQEHRQRPEAISVRSSEAFATTSGDGAFVFCRIARAASLDLEILDPESETFSATLPSLEEGDGGWKRFVRGTNGAWTRAERR